MKAIEYLIERSTEPNRIFFGEILAFRKSGTLLVRVDEVNSSQMECHLLYTAGASPNSPGPGDSVLVWVSGRTDVPGVVLGRVGPAAPRRRAKEEIFVEASGKPDSEKEPTPDELVIEAKKNLTIRCGEGSITLREDGKILVKGKDLVSRATRMNRIKGGAVSIN
jgi:hypothetical protein